MMQKDMKSLVAYSSVSHLGFVMLGVFAATPVALQGGVLQMINHGISTGALFLIVGHHLRAAPHPADLRVRRTEPHHAGVRDRLSDHDAEFDRDARV